MPPTAPACLSATPPRPRVRAPAPGKAWRPPKAAALLGRTAFAAPPSAASRPASRLRAPTDPPSQPNTPPPPPPPAPQPPNAA
jgi:hypothetical protein